MHTLFNPAFLASLSSDASAPVTLLTDLVGYYALESDGSDSHTNGYTLTGNGSELFGTGINGNGLQSAFLGNFYDASYVYDFNGKSFTYSFWFNCPDNTQTQTFVSWDSYGGVVTRLFTANYPGFYLYDGSNWNSLEFSTGIDNDTWYHLVARYDMGTQTMKLSVNGVTEILSSVSPAGASSDPRFYIGTESWGLQSNSIIDEVALWYRALSDDEVATLYNGGSGKFHGTF